MDHQATKERKRDPYTGPPDLLTEMSSPLVNKLMDCAKAVAEGDLKLADLLFEEMEVLTAEKISEATKKVVSCFAEALARRVHGVYPRNPVPLIPSSVIKYQTASFLLPISGFTSDALVGACISGMKAVHFIDFSIMLGSSGYDTLLAQCAPPQLFRLTSIGPNPCKDNYHLQEIKRKLTESARLLNIDFQHKQFEANFPADIEECVLKLERTSEDEIVIVRWQYELHKLLAVEGAIERVLSKLKGLKPKFMFLIEQEADHNSPDFIQRFAMSFRYYYRIFHYFDYLNVSDKMLMEKHGRGQISNIVACEGIGRFERHQTLAQWKERLLVAGFHPAQYTSNKLRNEITFPVLYPCSSAMFSASLWEPTDPVQFSCGVYINPITIQDASVSSVIEPEEVCSSESDDDNAYDSDTLRIPRIGEKWLDCSV